MNTFYTLVPIIIVLSGMPLGGLATQRVAPHFAAI